ncbi:TPA: hypothetical protein HA235_06955 [Candidatus Woesearchaeota archaeon]|nr:hypothetical protein [uncultured archaeon]MBS3172875.1 hypothetical protein [Candidatus Woesearchaeota archaeon]AQS34510.1 hypothetical protein [uncultured archaeon]AQS34532.1 hypothetical protein [uncultured archaeon]HIH32416.1 hypothetical protein [Candidatus Woesearchaeota archaeon]
MNFLELQKELQELNLDIFTIDDAIKITGQSKNVVKTKLALLAKQSKIFRLKKGYYSINNINNKFKLQKIFNNTYISLHSALEYYESTTQRFNNLDLISKNILDSKKTCDIAIQFHKVKNRFFFGFEKAMIDNTEIFISNIEKTIIDCIYFSSKIYLSEINKFIKKYKNRINKEIIIEYLNRIGSSALNKRTGYLLETNNIVLNGLKINNKYEKLNKNLPKNKSKDSKWKLIINEDLEE